MESTGISKKEYLKKYLSGGGSDKKKKKKKSIQSLIIKSKIVDDDIDLKNMKPVDADDLEIFDVAEEAPQIVGIIDERPEEIRVMSEYRSTKKWKIVTDEYGIEDVKITAIDRTKSNEGSPKREKEISIEIRKNSNKKNSDSDESPPRTKESKITIKKEVDSDSSSKAQRRKSYDSDASPPRRSIKKEKDNTPIPEKLAKENYDSDASPPRRIKIKKEKDSDFSPPRRSHREEDSDASPPRRRRRKDDSDESPPRRRKENFNHSPPRRKNREEDLHKKEKERNDSGSSPPRRKKRNDDSDSSLPRNNRDNHRDSENRSRNKENREKAEGARGRKRSPEVESSHKKNGDYGLKVSDNYEGSKKEKKNSQLEKTLSGKKAGLQNAADMKKEGEKLRQKEKEVFEKMSDDVTGKHATTIVRDRKTGKHHDAKEEARKRREKEEKEAEKIAQYAVWGKGVKQIQDRQDKMKEDLYEMSKPLARYKDDKDLEEMLKNQEREGDPMLDYIRKKKRSESGPSKPHYEGSYMPNRYGIRPGHKWDGVDRSNGYEKRWFEEQNAKKAREEEAFKWSTVDM